MNDLGKVAYEAYGEARSWKTVAGEEMPRWEEQTQELRDAWDAAAQAVVLAVEGE